MTGGKVFVGSLSPAVTEEALSDSFNYVGPVEDVKIVWEHETEPTPFAFLKFVLSADAKKAVEVLRFNKLLGRPMEVLEVTWSEENVPPDDWMAKRDGRQITVTNLDKNITEKDLWDTFDMFGVIERLKLARSKETGESQGKGFIAFKRAIDATNTCKSASGMTLRGKKLKVGMSNK